MTNTDTKNAYGEVESGPARSEGGGRWTTEQPLPPVPKAEPAQTVASESPEIAGQTAPAETLETTAYVATNAPQPPATIERLPETSRAIDTWQAKFGTLPVTGG